ncbi:MAG TPA: adenylate/guanylate cyclase domain-containing protein, partial [Candidatus Nitrosotalea sp.]|nr:adenylate/guanylate cyclase domain-containing protein [Candidatus Nitrosotalea sp.]
MAREVTLAFTDIEGSTARWERDRIAMQDAVRRHDAIIRGAIGNHRGRIFKTAGDAFCAVFDEPADAVAGMIEAQQRLAAEDFSAVAGLRVRAAVHTGVVEERESEYAGRAAGTIARLVAIGHGGQILLTGETAAVLGDALPRKASLHELGAYRLEEGGDLQRVYQLVATGLESNFPPLRSLGVLPGDRSVVDDLEFRSVRSFSGRQEELATLHAALKRDGAIAVVHGLGGVGKSSLAREYGRHYRDEYSILWWLNAESESGIVDGLLRLGATFVKGLDRLADRRVGAERVINCVLGGFDKPVLLVFDNLEDEGLMRTWLPRTGVRALATSRDSAWGSEIIAVPLDTWPLGTSAAYLRRASGRGDLSDADARAIVQALGALPLALSHAAAALRDVGVTPELYLAHVSEHLKDAPHEAEYPRSIFATFSTAIAQAEQHAAGAAALLCLASCFAPDGIPDELFRQAAEQNAGGLQPALAAGSALDLRAAIEDELCLDEALGALDRLSLLHFAPNSKTYEMHRLVQLAAQGLSGENAGAWRECAVAAANAAFPEKTDDLAAWSQCERLLPHARAALDALPGDCAFAHAGRLAIRCASYLWQRGEYTIAEQISNRGLEICERAL